MRRKKSDQEDGGQLVAKTAGVSCQRKMKGLNVFQTVVTGLRATGRTAMMNAFRSKVGVKQMTQS